MGFFDGGGGGGGFGDRVAGGALGSQLGGLAMGPAGQVVGGLGGFQSGLGGMSNKAIPKSNFQAQTPDIINKQDFASALANAQGNANMGFAPGANGAPSFAQALMGNYNQAQGQQQNLLNSLQQQAAGQGPGAQLAHNNLMQATQANNQQAAAMMASQRGMNPALAARLSGQNMTQANQQAAMQSSQLGLEQQLGAQQQLGNALAQNQQLSGNMFNNMTGQAGQQFGTLQQANTAQNQLGVNASLGAQGLNQATAAGNAAQLGQLEGGLISGVAGAAGKAATAGKAKGGKVMGKAKFNGDDARNDTVDAVLSPGEIVIPRSAAKSKEAAIRFLDALKAGESGWNQEKKKKKKSDEE